MGAVGKEVAEELYVLLVHVLSAQGSHIGFDGTSKSISNQADFNHLLRARSESDVAITGGSTARIEKLNSSTRCTLCIVTNDLSSIDSPALKNPGANRVLLLTSNLAFRNSRAMNSKVEKFLLGTSVPVAREIAKILKDVGFRRALLEAGPGLIAEFTRENLIDEVQVTVTGLEREMNPTEAWKFISKIPYLPQASEAPKVTFDGLNNYLSWCASGVAATF